MSEYIYPQGKNIALVDGKVVPIGTRGVSPSEVTAQIRSIAARPYLGKDPEKQGMTLIEAALYSVAKAAGDGDLDAAEKWLNRLIGRPVQTVISAQGSLSDFLQQVADNDPPNEVDPLED